MTLSTIGGSVGLVVLRQPVVQLGLGEQVARLREGRHPAAVLQPGVPADMIDVEMRAHDEVDVVHRQAGRGQAAHEGVVLLLVPQRTRGAVLVVADATIDQDVVACRSARCRTGSTAPGCPPHPAPPGASQDRFSSSTSGFRLRQELQRGGEAAFHLDDPMDRHVADAECVMAHPWARSLGWFVRMMLASRPARDKSQPGRLR